MVDGNATRAALVGYYPDFPIGMAVADMDEGQKRTYDTARTIGWDNLTKLDIHMDNLLDEAGLGDAYLATVLARNLEATRLYGKNGREHMDASARNKALEIALKLKGKLKDVQEVSLTGSLEVLASTRDVVRLIAQAHGINETNDNRNQSDS